MKCHSFRALAALLQVDQVYTAVTTLGHFEGEEIYDFYYQLKLFNSPSTEVNVLKKV